MIRVNSVLSLLLTVHLCRLAFYGNNKILVNDTFRLHNGEFVIISITAD